MKWLLNLFRRKSLEGEVIVKTRNFWSCEDLDPPEIFRKKLIALGIDPLAFGCEPEVTYDAEAFGPRKDQAQLL